MKSLLLTGFEPFGGDTLNPSAEAVKALAGFQPFGVSLHTALLPVDAAKAPGVIAGLIREFRPDAMLLTGLASGRPQLSVERVALNVQDFRLPDNAGVTRQNQAVLPDGPDAYLSTLPLEALRSSWRAAGIPAYISDTAGLYLCNLAMYVARHHLGPDAPCGFLHLPASAELALSARQPVPYLPQTEITRGVQIALETLAMVMNDTPQPAAQLV